TDLPCDARATTIGSDDHARALFRLRIAAADADHAPIRVAQQTRDLVALAHLDTGLARGVEQQLVEHRATDAGPLERTIRERRVRLPAVIAPPAVLQGRPRGVAGDREPLHV